jgi:hypothetical protein
MFFSVLVLYGVEAMPDKVAIFTQYLQLWAE